MLTKEESSRYARQIVMPEIDKEGQEKLLHSKVLVIGAGGLGSAVIYYLAAAGVGHIGIADGDNVEISNLQRQIIHTEARIGTNKAESAALSVKALNSSADVTVYPYFADADNIIPMISGYDFIIDATDKAENKYLVNDACVLSGKPFSHAGILRSGGQAMTYIPGFPCLRCVFGDLTKDKSPSCSQTGVMSMTCAMAGSIQAFEAVKYILGTGDLLTGRLLSFDGFTMRFRTIEIPCPDEKCSVCSPFADINDLSWYKKY